MKGGRFAEWTNGTYKALTEPPEAEAIEENKDTRRVITAPFPDPTLIVGLAVPTTPRVPAPESTLPEPAPPSSRDDAAGDAPRAVKKAVPIRQDATFDRLLDALDYERPFVPVQKAETDGDFAAAHSAPPSVPPAGVETPPLEPRTQLSDSLQRELANVPEALGASDAPSARDVPTVQTGVVRQRATTGVPDEFAGAPRKVGLPALFLGGAVIAFLAVAAGILMQTRSGAPDGSAAGVSPPARPTTEEVLHVTSAPPPRPALERPSATPTPSAPPAAPSASSVAAPRPPPIAKTSLTEQVDSAPRPTAPLAPAPSAKRVVRPTVPYSEPRHRNERMRLMRRTVPLLLVTAFVLQRSPARGDEGTTAEAKALFNEGQKLAATGDYEHARLKFQAASGLSKSPSILWNLAYTEMRSAHYVEGVRHLRRYLREPTADPKHVELANSELLPTATPKIGQIRIEGEPGITITLDSNDTPGVTPFEDPVAVEPGKHHLEASLGEKKTSQDVEVTAGQVVAVAVSFPAPPTAADLEPGGPIHLKSAAGSVPEPPEDSTRATGLTTGRKVAIGLGVGAVVVASTGIGVGLVAKSDDDSAAEARSRGNSSYCYQSTSRQCASLNDASSAARSDAVVATVLDIGGGVLAAGAVVTWLVFGPPGARSGTYFVPAVAPGVAGIRLGRDF